jgi:NAD(P)-dependent dehydrogenase (short-subunit alcohol dehydrogenase family)
VSPSGAIGYARMSGLLTDRHAIVYGAGAIGAVVARTFAREGATVHLAGRNEQKLDAAAAAVAAEGAIAHVTRLDVLDEAAVDAHARDVAQSAGRLDVTINLATRGDVQGTPLLDMAVEDFMAPIVAGARANFVTGRAAGRIMVEQGSGVILMIGSGSAGVLKPSPAFAMGGTGPADAASESFMHYLAAEVGPRGVRVATLWTAGVFYPEQMAPVSMMGRGPTAEQFADTAAFVASDRGSGITGSIVNVSAGVSGL